MFRTKKEVQLYLQRYNHDDWFNNKSNWETRHNWVRMSSGDYVTMLGQREQKIPQTVNKQINKQIGRQKRRLHKNNIK